jgi:hypothetical protein
MAKWLNCCGEADHLLFCLNYATLLTYSNTYSISTPNNLYPICRTPYSIVLSTFVSVVQYCMIFVTSWNTEYDHDLISYLKLLI